MVEKLINIIINELNKHDIGGSCVLASYIFNQCVPNSETVKGYLIRGECYCLHVWIKYDNKIYDIANIQNMRNFDMSILPSPQYSIKKPDHLENVDDDYEEFYSQLQDFNTNRYYNDAPHNVKKCIKAVKRKYAKISPCILVK